MESLDYRTDVLIIGGGLAGLTAAVKIKELRRDLDVLVVDKGGIGWAGQTPLTGGMCIYVPPDSLEGFVQSIVEKGHGLANVDWLTAFARSMPGSFDELMGWKVPFMMDPDGKLFLSDASTYWKAPNKLTSFLPHRILLRLKKMASERGVRMLDKIEVVDLLKEGERVTGAAGFDILGGKFCVFNSKSTLLANGCCNFKGRVWFSMNCGEGIAAAYRAGAKQRHCEYAHQYDPGDRQSAIWWRGEAASDFIENAHGEKIFKRYFPDETRLGSWALSYAMGAEAMAGRAPLYLDVRKDFERFDSHLNKEDVRTWIFERGGFLDPERLHRDRGGVDLRKDKSEWTVRLVGRMGSVRVGVNCRNEELEGFWAAGDSVISGCAMNGAMSANAYGRWGLPFAFVSALRAAEDIAKAAPGIAAPSTNLSEQKMLKEKIFAPFKSTGKSSPQEAVRRVHQVVIPVKYNLIREGSRLKEGLGILEQVQKEILPGVKVENPHELLRYHEAESMALCAEMVFRAALSRNESRGSHFREDHPQKDDKNWLKWTIVQKDGERMTLSTEAVSGK